MPEPSTLSRQPLVVVDPEWAKPSNLGPVLWSYSTWNGISFQEALQQCAGFDRQPTVLERYWTGHGCWELYEGGLVVRRWGNYSDDDPSIGPCIYARAS